MLLEDYRTKLAQQFQKLNAMKEQNLQDQVEYHDLFNEMTRTFEVVKDLER